VSDKSDVEASFRSVTGGLGREGDAGRSAGVWVVLVGGVCELLRIVASMASVCVWRREEEEKDEWRNDEEWLETYVFQAHGGAFLTTQFVIRYSVIIIIIIIIGVIIGVVIIINVVGVIIGVIIIVVVVVVGVVCRFFVNF